MLPGSFIQKTKKGAMTVLILGDCLQEMKAIPDGSVDLVLTDLPYGVTNAEWGTIPIFGEDEPKLSQEISGGRLSQSI